jgi:hypothetical protein
MKIIKESRRGHPKVSLVLLDWSVRESFHLLHYLARQDVPRENFEVLVIEYYSRVSEALGKFENEVDAWLLLEMPEDCYYHKHVMYNAGIALARGEIVVICDSDAMVKPGFIRAIVEAFERDPHQVLHLDQFRNNRRDFYPFSYPSFEQVEGEGCVNNSGGRTTGILDSQDPIHTRNYGACMCARRADLIAIGGADEHVDFAGHICGPYDMTFRLVNNGMKELWHSSEFMYHTWHPGQAGVDNYLGPHDGRHVSTTSLAALSSRRVRPLLENLAIRRLREQPQTPAEAVLPLLIRPEGPDAWRRAKLEAGSATPEFDAHDMHIGYHKGYSIYRKSDGFYARLAIEPHRSLDEDGDAPRAIEASTLAAVRKRIGQETPWVTALALAAANGFVIAWQLAHYLKRKALGRSRAAARQAGASLLSSGSGVRFRQRLAQFWVERGSIVDALGNLVPNLRQLKRSGNSAASRDKVVVGDRRTEVYLKLLRAVGAIPQVQIDLVLSSDQVARIVTETAARSGPSCLVLARGLYYNCYPSVAPLRVERAFSVV